MASAPAERYGESPPKSKHGHNWADIAASACMSRFARTSFHIPRPQSHQAKYQLHIAALVKDYFGIDGD